MPIAKLSDIDIYYEIEGDKGPWLIFAHGGGDNHLAWWRQVGALKDRYRCLVYDARWHGKSGIGAVLTDADQVGWKDLLGLMDLLKIDKAYLNGHSMGGGAVAGVALNHPDRALALVMTCTVFGFDTPTLSKWAGQMIDKVTKGLNIMASTYAPDYPVREPASYYLHEAIKRMNPPRPVPRDSKDYLKAYERMRDRPPGDYSGFKVPTLFILAEEDQLQLPWLAEGVVKSVPIARLARLPGSGHTPHVERPDEYLAMLTGFLEANGGPA